MILIWSKTNGRLGNRIFNLMLGRTVGESIKNSRVVYEQLPEFGQVKSPQPLNHLHRQWSRHVINLQGHVVNWSELEEFLSDGEDGHILNHGLGMRFEYFGTQRAFWQERVGRLASETLVEKHEDSETLYIHIRAQDILRGVNPDYFPLPVRFYRELLEQARDSGIRRAEFVGQITGQHPYLQELRAEFSDCTFSVGDAMSDFIKLATARYRVLSISSFAWLAAWMSPTPSLTVIPRAGILNPEQRPDIDLLSEIDSTFVQCDFGISRLSPEEELTHFLPKLEYSLPRDVFSRGIVAG